MNYSKELQERLDTKRIPYLVFIGTSTSYIDGIAPRLGSRLNSTFRTLGKDDKNLDAKTLEKHAKDIAQLDKDIYQVIGVDCTYHENFTDKPEILFLKTINPGSYVGKKLPSIGEFGIGINVATCVKSFTEFFCDKPRQDIQELEDLAYHLINNSFYEYKLPLQVAILLDKGKTKEEICNTLNITNKQLNRAINNMLEENNKIYQRFKEV